MEFFKWLKYIRCKPAYQLITEPHFCFDESDFAFTLDHVMEFLKEYMGVDPEGWYQFQISHVQQNDPNSDRVYGYIKFRVTLAHSLKSLPYWYSNASQYMETMFEFDPEENSYVCFTQIGTGIGKSYPTKRAIRKLRRYLKRYKAAHPDFRFAGHK